jgi:sporulation protein YlmC with PRC-barrel domain
MYDYRINAQDGEIGKVYDIFIDDEKWIIRYLVVDTGTWLSGRRVLLSPVAFTPPNEKPDWSTQTVPVFLTKKEVQNAPDVYADKPISRQKEIDMAQYYQWPYYWVNDPYMVPYTPYFPQTQELREEAKGDSHLRSTKEVNGYHIETTDGTIGHIEDYIFDDELWNILYCVANTRNILPGKKVLLPLLWIRDIDWAESKVHVDVTTEQVKNGPTYDPEKPVNREQEEVIYDYYGRPRYWASEKAAE